MWSHSELPRYKKYVNVNQRYEFLLTPISIIISSRDASTSERRKLNICLDFEGDMSQYGLLPC